MKRANAKAMRRLGEALAGSQPQVGGRGANKMKLRA
jgi:hypothetical protein